MKLALHLATLTLLTLSTLHAQQAHPPDTTVEHPFTSPTGHFTLTVPEQWSTETEPGTSEVTFSRGSVSVMVSGDTMPADKPVESFLELNQLMMQKSCPAATVVSQGAQTVAGLPGKYLLVRCPGTPGGSAQQQTQSTDIRVAATYTHGRLYAFTTTILTRFAAEAQPVFDTVAASYHILPDTPETAAEKKARYAAAEAAFARDNAAARKLCESGTVTQTQCAARLANLQATRTAAEEGSTATSGTVINR